jgi:hypothetical protein
VNNREINKYEMLLAVYGYYAKKKDSAGFISAVATAFENIDLIAKEIALNEGILQEGNQGKIASRDVSKDELIRTALVIAGAVYGYAAGMSDAELLITSDINSRTLIKLRNSELPIFVEKFLDKADEIGENLVPYGVTVEQRTNVRSLLDDYIAKYGNVNSGKTGKKTAHETIRLLLTNADAKLKMLDKLMLGVREKDSALYSEYEAARVIIDKASTHNTGDESTNTASTNTVSSSSTTAN